MTSQMTSQTSDYATITGEEYERAVETDSLTDALTTLLRGRGHRVLVGHWLDRTGNDWTSILSAEDAGEPDSTRGTQAAGRTDRWALRSYETAVREREWADAFATASDAYTGYVSLESDRETILLDVWPYRSGVRGTLIGYISGEATSPFSGRMSTHPGHQAARSAALEGWWDERLTEGHTPQSAGVMLALLLPPQMLGLLTFDDSGTPFYRPPAPKPAPV